MKGSLDQKLSVLCNLQRECQPQRQYSMTTKWTKVGFEGSQYPGFLRGAAIGWPSPTVRVWGLTCGGLCSEHRSLVCLGWLFPAEASAGAQLHALPGLWDRSDACKGEKANSPEENGEVESQGDKAHSGVLRKHNTGQKLLPAGYGYPPEELAAGWWWREPFLTQPFHWLSGEELTEEDSKQHMTKWIKFFTNEITSWGDWLTFPSLLPVASFSCWFVVSLKLGNRISSP